MKTLSGIGLPSCGVVSTGEPSDYYWAVPYEGRMAQLNQLNDLESLTFYQIADIIEATVDTYPEYLEE